MYDIQRIRSDLEEFTSLVDEEYYLNRAGLKDKTELTKIYGKFAHLFNRDTIDYVEQISRISQGEDERRVGYLRAFLVGEYMENEVKELSDKLLTMESQAMIKVNGESSAFRQSAIIMTNEPLRDRRASIFEARDLVIQELNPILEARTRILQKTSRDLGYQSYSKLYEDIKGLELEALEKMLKPFLEETRSAYTRAMNELLQARANLSLSDAEKHDVGFAFRARQFDRFFRKEDALQTLKRTLIGLGIRLDSQTNIHVDMEERPRKDPRAFVSPVRVPSDIRLVLMPQGGHDDYATLFHEAGHAEHFGCTRADLPVEYRYLGDNSLTEGFAFLMEYLLTNQHWLAKFTEMKDSSEFLKFVRLYKLYFLRRYAAKLSYEMILHTNGLQSAASRYSEILQSVLGFKHRGSHYLVDVDDGFYSANYLRAWIFEAQIERILGQHFGENWFERKGAGIQLQQWWSLGQKYRVEEVLRDMGYRGLDIGPLVEELQIA